MTSLLIAAAQCASEKGAVEANVETHLRFAAAAAAEGAALLVFPELSLTGYELGLAESHRMLPCDFRLAPLAEAAERTGMTIMAGAPWDAGAGKPYLGAFLFSPSGRDAYAKIHVHETEAPYFQPGQRHRVLDLPGGRAGLAICADTAFAEHPAATAALGAEVYAAGIMKTAEEFVRHAENQAAYAKRHGIATMTSNYVGVTGGTPAGGLSALWDPSGRILAQADGVSEALIVGRRQDGVWQGRCLTL